ncbi:hypothetical protein DAPPUDRAFT_318630 [Daphnia pulex]|uniref:Uncharacterized protein n=1 Tax=Daphnia pulex TaxID=6669 RepID=E9GJE3_DAPPU|nr:hypothetical protein DAPPUDRAFT_318630 [Daphnia pulex]|eukprot:EFX80507.1 hypothetical protein DAPPUDRAFT_318630 [Daphnia pulex]
MVNEQQNRNGARTGKLSKRKKLALKRLTHGQEKKAILITKNLARALFLFKRELKHFLKSWGLAPRKLQDTSTLLKKMIDYNQQIPDFFGKTKRRVEVDTATLLKATYGRNAVFHGNLPFVLRDWKKFLRAWITVANMIGAKSLAQKLRKMMTRLLSSHRRQPYTVSKNTIFMSVASEETTKWTSSKGSAAIAIGHIVFDTFLQDVTPNLRTFVDSNKIRPNWTSVLDAYELSNIILDKCSADCFFVPPGTQDEDELIRRLEEAMEGRHAVSHDMQENIFYNWEQHLKDCVYILTAIHCPDAAARVQKRLDQLTTSRDQAKKQFSALTARRVTTVHRSFLQAKKSPQLKGKPGKWPRPNSRWLKGMCPSQTIGDAFRFRLKNKVQKILH